MRKGAVGIWQCEDCEDKCGSSVLYVQISIISSIQDTEDVLKGVQDVLTNCC